MKQKPTKLIVNGERRLQHFEVIRETIDETLKENGWVSEFWILEVLKTRIHPTELYNWALDTGVDTKDGVRNLEQGAEALYRHAMKALGGLYTVEGNKIRHLEEVTV